MQTRKTGFSSRSETIIMGRSNTERWAWVTCFSLLSGWNSSLTVKSIKNKWNSQKNLHSMKCMECTKKKAQHCICASVNFAISAFIPVMHWSAQVHNCASAPLHGQGRQGMQLSLQTKSFHHRIWVWQRRGDDKDFFKITRLHNWAHYYAWKGFLRKMQDVRRILLFVFFLLLGCSF